MINIARRVRHTPRNKGHGQALPEFAIIAPVLILLIMGILDFGRGIYAYSAVSNAARMGARTAIVNQNPVDISGRAAGQATGLGIDPTAPCTATWVCVTSRTRCRTQTARAFTARLKS
jgi:Flp pilus assembly protein TadG